LQRSWRHLDFFQFEAWLHAGVPRVACSACGKTSQLPVPWSREGTLALAWLTGPGQLQS
jgi:transposase